MALYLLKFTNEIPVPIALYPSIYLVVFFKNVDYESPVFSFSRRFSLVAGCYLLLLTSLEQDAQPIHLLLDFSLTTR